MGDLLTVSHLGLSFGGLRALDDVSLQIADGQVVGLIGPNGAGKTSLLNCISRFYHPQQGQIAFAGHDLLRRPPHALAALGVTRTFQHMELVPHLTILENVLIGAQVRERPSLWSEALGLSAARRSEAMARSAAEATLDLVGLRPQATRSVTALPLGLQKRVGLARALAARPRLLLLDEPAGGLNSTEKRDLLTLLHSLRETLQLTILLIEHDMDLVMALCDTLVVLDFGRCIAAGPPDAVRRDPAVITAYLGVE